MGRHEPTRRRSFRIYGIPLLVAGAGLLNGAAPPPGASYSFVLGNIYLANGGEKDQCPAPSDGGVEIFFKSLPEAERAPYAQADRPAEISSEKRAALERMMAARLGMRSLWVAKAPNLPAGYTAGSVPTDDQLRKIAELNGFPKGKAKLAFQNRRVDYNSCTHPADFPMLADGMRTYDGPVAAGMNLDGKSGKGDFTGPDGTGGVDNELWRVTGCVKALRESSDPETARRTLISALAPTLITLEGVDDLRNDPEVVVHVRASIDPVVRDGRGQLLARATFTADPDPSLSSVGRGRIVDGILTSDPFDLVLAYKEQIIDAPRELRGVRIQATLKPDGTIEGGLYGYQLISSVYRSIEQMTQAGANANGLSCPAMHKALATYADGYPDRRTGRPAAISAAYHFFGTKAFVVTAEQEKQGGGQ